MKIFWKFLPLALPLLVLIAVLTGCGKGPQVNSANIFKASKDTTKTVLGQRATGAGAGGAIEIGPVDLDAFKKACAEEKNGRVEMTAGRYCVVPGTLAVLKSNTQGAQLIADLNPGDLIETHGSVSPSDADLTIDNEHYMSIGERKVATRGGKLSFYVINPRANAEGTVQIWTCLNTRFERVFCNLNVLRGNI